MQIGTISIIGSMRLVKDEHTCLTPFRISNNRPLTGYALSLFAEKIIKKYEILGDYGFEPFSLVFLQNLWAETDQNRELETRVEQTLRLLILWNQRHEINNQLICHQNVYLTSLKNEIEINLSYIKQLSLSQYQQLHKLYSSESAEQNLMVCKTLISQLDSADSASVRPTPMVRENQVINIVGAPPIKPHSLAQPFRTLLGNVVNINYTPGNRELFYSTVRNQLFQHLIKHTLGDNSNWENMLPYLTEGSLKDPTPINTTQFQTQTYHIAPSSFNQVIYTSAVNNVYRNLLADKSSGDILLNPGQLLEFVQNADQKNLMLISPRVIQLLNQDKYGTLQRLNTRLFSDEQSREIFHLIINRGRLSPEVLSFLSRPSLTKSELLRIVEEGTWQEKVLVFEALNYAAEKIAPTQLNKTFSKNIATLNSLLKNIENNDFDFSRYYELEGTKLTLKQYLSREEHLIWNEIENQINQYKAVISRQLDSISIVEEFLSPIIKNNRVGSLLRDRRDQGIFHNLGTITNLVSVGAGRMVSLPQDLVQKVEHIIQNMKESLPQNTENRWLRGGSVLQYHSPQASTSTSNSETAAGYSDRNQAGVRGLITQLSDLINIRRYQIRTFEDEKYRRIYGEEKTRFGSPLTGSHMSRQLQDYTKPAEKISQGVVKTPIDFSLPKASLIMMEKNIQEAKNLSSLSGQPEPVRGDQVFNKRSVYTADDKSGNLIMKSAAEEAVQVKQSAQKAEHLQTTDGKLKPVAVDHIEHMRDVYTPDTSGNLILKGAASMAITGIKNELIAKHPLKGLIDVNKSSLSILKNVTNIAFSRFKTQPINKPFALADKTETQSLSRYLINQNTANIMAHQGNYDASNYIVNDYHAAISSHTDIGHNTVQMILASNKEPVPERTSTPARRPTQEELINRFGNLIADPNIPPPELIGRQAGSLISNSKLGTSAKSLGAPELVKKITLDERIIREEQRRVTEIHQKVKEQEELINKLNQAYNELQEEMASRISERRIASLIMKELRAKLSLDKMRYGLQ